MFVEKVVVVVLLLGSTFRVQSFELRTLKATVSTEGGSGMDGGTFGDVNLGGGAFYVQLCSSFGQCCETDRLNTNDDNWEIGEDNYFVGTQLGPCQDFELGQQEEVVGLTLQHKGSDGGKLDQILLLGSLRDTVSYYKCPIGIKLDSDEHLKVDCEFVQVSGHKTKCNGHEDFCSMNFDKVTFPGAHNAGTGLADPGHYRCMIKNHDLNTKEMLDFGLRFFDYDIIYDNFTSGCDGLMTGHGPLPEIGLYWCFGKVQQVLEDMNAWLLDHPSEVVVVYFGAIKYDQLALPALKSALLQVFSGQNVGMNDVWQKTGVWPTLGQAVATNKRVFAIIRHENVHKDEPFLREIQVKESHPDPEPVDGAVTVISTYKSGSIGTQCSTVVDNSGRLCQLLQGQLVKLAVFGPWRGWDCLWDLARPCNAHMDDAVMNCLQHKPTVNFIQTDYPNYPAGTLSVVQLAHQLNLEKA